ncbi:MAG: PP2C family protein-serine/threonine phosphatase [Candidatus Krumholzibacteria bacterium]|nr:PP2C family protein-serine/threonine phosphatase [Candidatus Krumholzibacteria bacterium]MDH5268657.1 PP2C family protein-serine/threonine phosphatase [Candidatus Krumholzibacteria bacterium]
MTGPFTVVISLVYLVVGVSGFLLALTLLRVGRNSAPTRAAALMLFFASVGPLLSASGIILERSLRDGAVLYTSMVVNFEYLWEFYFPSLLLFALSFPTENRVLNRYPALGLVIFLPYIFHLAAMMFGDRMLDQLSRMPDSIATEGEFGVGPRELTLTGFDAVLGALVRMLERVHRNLFAVVNIVYSLVALEILNRSQNGPVNARLSRQLRVVALGVLASVIFYTFAKVALLARIPAIPDNTGLALLNLSLVASGGAIAYAVIRHQFLGVRNVLERSLLYGVVAALFAGIYLLLVRPIAIFFGQYSAGGREAFEAGFVMLVVIAFQPAIERAESVLEHALARGRGGLAQRFKRVGDGVAAATTREDLDLTVTRGLREVLDASDARLVLVSNGSDPVAAALLKIGEPVRRRDLLAPAEPRRRPWRRRPRKRREDGDAPPTLRPDLLPAGIDVFVPIIQGRTCVAYVTLAEKVYGLTYGAEELGHLALLSTQIGAAFQNIRLLAESVERKVFEEELKIARKIQMQMLPSAPPSLPGFDLFGVTVPSRQVGGDYYDFVLVDGRWLVVVVADVSGKGIPASILTATLQATVRTNTDAQTQPRDMMARLNRLLYRNTSAAEFATVFYAVLDMESGAVRFSNAGHEFPFLVTGAGARMIEESGMVLGCLEEFDYLECDCHVPAGGSLVVYTDGVTDSEARNGDYYGAPRLRSVLERNGDMSARDVCRRVIEDVRAFGDGENQDDLTVVVLKRNP